mmetsp:Transcript_54298/g.129397  ORF Transcript_54298/g.129397 Transcript_54298/m.129397 type:complete len:80 (-) Transcript_54298:773-1012(-)
MQLKTSLPSLDHAWPWQSARELPAWIQRVSNSSQSSARKSCAWNHIEWSNETIIESFDLDPKKPPAGRKAGSSRPASDM